MTTSYLTFHENLPEPNRKTAVWDVRSGQQQTLLGKISWYAPWRRYCYSPTGPQVLDAACMTEIVAFLQTQMAKYKAIRADATAEVV